MLRIVLAFLLLLVSLAACGQFASSEKSVRKNIARGKWEAARVGIRKSLEKDTVNAAAHYLASLWFFSPSNPHYNIDSAWLFANTAIRTYPLLQERERVRLKRVPLDSLTLVVHRSRIDSAAFERARTINTEGAFNFFLERFPSADQRKEAVALRDEAAFLAAERINSYESFLSYLSRYPVSVRADEARRRYEMLLYESKTRPQTLQSFEVFLRDYPASPYRREAENRIFELLTASGEPERFKQFIDQYPRSIFVKRARDLLFHVVEAADVPSDLDTYLNDSLKLIGEANKGFLIPYLEEGRFGLMNQHGKSIVSNVHTSIPEEYLCGNIVEEILMFNGRMTNRRGVVIFPDSVDDLEDIGAGFLKVLTGGCHRIIHKSGFAFSGCFENSRVIGNRFVAAKKNNRWGLYTLTGRMLVSHTFDEIDGLRNVAIFRKEGEYRVVSFLDERFTEGRLDIFAQPAYVSVKPWSGNLIVCETETEKGVFDQRLRPVIPMARQELSRTFFGALARVDNYLLYNSAGEKLASSEEVLVHQPWVFVKNGNKYFNYDLFHRSVGTREYDSVTFAGVSAIGYRGDSVDVNFSPGVRKVFSMQANPVFLPGKDSIGFLMITEEKKKSVFTPGGQRILRGDFDQVQYAGDGFFTVSRKERKGVVSSAGKIVVPLEMDAIGTFTSQVVTFLKSMKFGAYNAANNKTIRPQFEKNVIVVSPDILAVYDKGKYKLVNWDNRPAGTVVFDEIQHWTDSIKLIRQGNSWSLYHIHQQRILFQGITSIRYISDNVQEKIAVLGKDNRYGVWSSKRGQVIPITFTALINVGSAEEPVYFTEKHVEEASLFVVIYYDKDGVVIRRHVYEEQDYERILCPD